MSFKDTLNKIQAQATFSGPSKNQPIVIHHSWLGWDGEMGDYLRELFKKGAAVCAEPLTEADLEKMPLGEPGAEILGPAFED